MDGLVLHLFLLQVTGVMGLQKIAYFKPLALTWYQAQVYCREHYSDLVTIRTADDNNKITEDSWLGLYRENSATDFKWSKGDEPLTFLPGWASGPDVDKHCVFKGASDTGWKTEDCTQEKHFFCAVESMYLVKEKKTWEEALAHCRAMGVMDPTVHNNHSYDLASLMTPEDHVTAREIIQMATTELVWTGLRFLGDRWVWVGREDVQYGDIDSCPAQHRCGALDKSSTKHYNISECDERNNFLCYKRPAAA